MGIVLRAWKTLPGLTFPVPVISDDRRRLPAADVRLLQQWLQARRDYHMAMLRPTGQLLGLPGIVNHNGVGSISAKAGTAEAAQFVAEDGKPQPFVVCGFQSGTHIIPFEHNSMTVNWHVLIARDPGTGITIVAENPVLWVEHKAVPISIDAPPVSAVIQ